MNEIQLASLPLSNHCSIRFSGLPIQLLAENYLLSTGRVMIYLHYPKAKSKTFCLIAFSFIFLIIKQSTSKNEYYSLSKLPSLPLFLETHDLHTIFQILANRKLPIMLASGCQLLLFLGKSKPNVPNSYNGKKPKPNNIGHPPSPFVTDSVPQPLCPITSKSGEWKTNVSLFVPAGACNNDPGMEAD